MQYVVTTFDHSHNCDSYLSRRGRLTLHLDKAERFTFEDARRAEELEELRDGRSYSVLDLERGRGAGW